MNIKFITIVFGVLLISGLILYPVFVIAAAELNPFAWSDYTRGSYAFCWMVLFVFIGDYLTKTI